jgi:hypothetical protein
MDFEAFKTWWLTEHTLKVKKWPGLAKCHINLCSPPDQARDGATSTASNIAILLTEEHIIVE